MTPQQKLDAICAVISADNKAEELGYLAPINARLVRLERAFLLLRDEVRKGPT